MNITGKQIKLARVMSDIKAKDLAKKLGVSNSYMWQIEDGQKDSKISEEMQEKIVEIFPDIFGIESDGSKLYELKRNLREFVIDFDRNGMRGKFQDYMKQFRETVGLNGEQHGTD